MLWLNESNPFWISPVVAPTKKALPVANVIFFRVSAAPFTKPFDVTNFPVSTSLSFASIALSIAASLTEFAPDFIALAALEANPLKPFKELLLSVSPPELAPVLDSDEFPEEDPVL